MTDIRRMQMGQLVDVVITYNERQEQAERRARREEERGRKRRATQDEINAFFG